MSITINFKKDDLKKTSSNLVLFVDEKFSNNHLKKYTTGPEFDYIVDLLKTSDPCKKILLLISLTSFLINSSSNFK